MSYKSKQRGDPEPTIDDLNSCMQNQVKFLDSLFFTCKLESMYHAICV